QSGLYSVAELDLIAWSAPRASDQEHLAGLPVERSEQPLGRRQPPRFGDQLLHLLAVHRMDHDPDSTARPHVRWNEERVGILRHERALLVVGALDPRVPLFL